MDSGLENPSDHLVVGGGLAGGLIALALADVGRGRGVVLVDQDRALGGNHTWSFHDSDLDASQHQLVAALVTQRWPRQLVRFPGRERTIDTGYATISSANFARVVTDRLQAAGARLLLGRKVSSVEESRVQLDDGTVIHSDRVIDARGPQPGPTGSQTGYQKFLGLELELATDGPWTVPIVMDATVPQIDGYRFIYVLPFSPRRVLVEDTMYSGNPALDLADVERRVLAYVERCGATVSRVLRSESGVLPLPIRKSPSQARDQRHFPLAVGYRAGFFHPVTGYSLPIAARVALAIAKADTPGETVTAVRAISESLRGQRRFERLLNRLMFNAMAPDARWTALDRFYRLPDATINRFYGSRNTRWDRMRVLLGRPPRGICWRGLFSKHREKS